MTSLLKLTALRQLNLTDSMELTQGRFAQLATLSSLHALCLRDCFELKACPVHFAAPPSGTPALQTHSGSESGYIACGLLKVHVRRCSRSAGCPIDPKPRQ